MDNLPPKTQNAWTSSNVPPPQVFPRGESNNGNKGKSSNKKETSFSKLFFSFMEGTTAHGLPRVVTSASWFRKISWLLVFCGCFSYFTYQTVQLFKNYYGYPIGVKMSILNKHTVQFPAVTVCNMNMIKKSKAQQDDRYKDLVSIDQYAEYDMNRKISNLNTEAAKSGITRKRRSLDDEEVAYLKRRNIEQMQHSIDGSKQVVELPPKLRNCLRMIKHKMRKSGTLPYLPSDNERLSDVVTKGLHPGWSNTLHEEISSLKIPKAHDHKVASDSQESRKQKWNDLKPNPLAHVKMRKHKLRTEQEDTNNLRRLEVTDDSPQEGSQDDSLQEGFQDDSLQEELGRDQLISDRLKRAVVDELATTTMSTENIPEISPDDGSGSDYYDPESDYDTNEEDSYDWDNWYDMEEEGEDWYNPQEYEEDWWRNDFEEFEGEGDMYTDEYMDEFEFADYGFGKVKDDYEFKQFMKASQTQDYSDLVDVLKPTQEDLDLYGHQGQDFILQCSFDKRNCSYLDFRKVYNPFYGLCYVFNHGTDGNKTVRKTSKFGSRYGLRLTLDIEYDQYLGLFSHKAGARLSIHPHDITAFPQDFGVSAAPGRETEIGVALETMNREPHPFPSNCTDGKNHRLAYEGNYTITSCSMTCLQTELKERCKCVDKLVTNSSEPRCSITNKTQEACRQMVYYLYDSSNLGCDCPPACQDHVYKVYTSSSEWPSSPYSYLLATSLVKEKANYLTSDLLSKIKTTMVRAHVYLENPTMKAIAEYPSYPWDRLLADIGGLLGLFIGVSACTGVEVLEFLIDAIIHTVRILTQRSKTPHGVQPMMFQNRHPNFPNSGTLNPVEYPETNLLD